MFFLSFFNIFYQFVAGTQPVNALAFVLDGLYYGVSDFGYAAYSMVLPRSAGDRLIIYYVISPSVLFHFLE